MPDTRIPPSDDTTPFSTRSFWAVFAGGWLAYVGLFATVAAQEEGLGPGAALAVTLGNVLPPALLGAVVAARRRMLLAPERSLVRTVLLHAAVGVVYVLLSATLMTLAASAGLGEPPPATMPAAAVFAYRAVNSAFLYTILVGFLMWSESLRRVHESTRAAAHEAMLRAQAEAKALRAQFNPHFVFNTLHSLMLLVRSDTATAEQAIEDVAELIRYASILQRRGVDVVPLHKELAVARRYLALEKLRLADRLRSSFRVEVDPERVTVPAFALQTLLENAIKHGLEPREAGGAVEVSAERVDGELCLTVSDDGEGADPERIPAADGHGLDLLRRRLQTLYGGDASLALETAPGAGFRAVVRLPARPPGPDWAEPGPAWPAEPPA